MNFSLLENYSTTGFLSSSDRTQVFYRHYAVPGNKAKVLLVHGFGEHSGRYSHIIDRLARENFEVTCLDFRGHGHSKGCRGDVEKFSHYEDDVDTALKFVQTKDKKSKIFILAHSMGALVSLRLLTRTANTVDGLVLSCPLFALKLSVPLWKKHLGSVVAKVLPKIKVQSGIKGFQLSSDKSFSDAYDNDPLVLKNLSIRAFGQIVEGYEGAKNLAPKLKSAFLMQVAGKDPVVDTDAAKKWFKSADKLTRDASLKVYPDLLHEIYNETGREEAINDMISWLNQRAE